MENANYQTKHWKPKPNKKIIENFSKPNEKQKNYWTNQFIQRKKKIALINYSYSYYTCTHRSHRTNKASAEAIKLNSNTIIKISNNKKIHHRHFFLSPLILCFHFSASAAHHSIIWLFPIEIAFFQYSCHSLQSN